MSTTPGCPIPPLTKLSEDQAMFRQAVHDFADAEVRPLVHRMGRTAEFDRSMIPKLAEFGGAGGSFFMTVLAVEELTAVDVSTAVLVDVQNTLVTAPLVLWGSDHLKRRYLPRLAAGAVGAYALSEPGSWSEAFRLATCAEAAGGERVLTSRKMWITNGAEAEVYVVFATVAPSLGYKGITAVVVEREFPGFSVGKREDKRGIRASSTTELILDGCHVPEENLLGEIGKGYKVAIETLNGGWIGIGAQMVGMARGALHVMLSYVRERRQFGRPVAEFQGRARPEARAPVPPAASRVRAPSRQRRNRSPVGRRAGRGDTGSQRARSASLEGTEKRKLSRVVISIREVRRRKLDRMRSPPFACTVEECQCRSLRGG